MEVLPITNTISQWPPLGNGPVTKLEIGNIGTGNISTMATLNGRCQPDGSLSGVGSVGGLLAVVKSDCTATNLNLYPLTSTLTPLPSTLYPPTYDANGNITMRHHHYTPFYLGIALCLAGCTLGPDSIAFANSHIPDVNFRRFAALDNARQSAFAWAFLGLYPFLLTLRRSSRLTAGARVRIQRR